MLLGIWNWEGLTESVVPAFPSTCIDVWPAWNRPLAGSSWGSQRCGLLYFLFLFFLNFALFYFVCIGFRLNMNPAGVPQVPRIWNPSPSLPLPSLSFSFLKLHSHWLFLTGFTVPCFIGSPYLVLWARKKSSASSRRLPLASFTTMSFKTIYIVVAIHLAGLFALVLSRVSLVAASEAAL